MNKEEEKRLDNKQYMQILNSCHELFSKKLQDYGPAWRILRPSSVTDQIYIKVARIRSLQLTGENLVGESIESEFIGIVNYGIVGIIQFVKGFAEKVDITVEEAERLYNIGAEDCIKIMEKKNHDYGEAWRNMRVETITDLILSKVFRTKQIEDNNGNTIASEGIAANYIDMVNYAIFALCLLAESPKAVGRKPVTEEEWQQFAEQNGVIIDQDGRFVRKDDDGVPHLGEKVYVGFMKPEITPGAGTKQ